MPHDNVVKFPSSKSNSSNVDLRKLRGSPLREEIAPISRGVTVIGKMHTADLRGYPLSKFTPEREELLQSLAAGAAAARRVAVGLDEAAERLLKEAPVIEMSVAEKYFRLTPEQRHKVDAIFREKTETNPLGTSPA